MDELLKAIERLKRAYKASGAKSLHIDLGKDETVQIDGVDNRVMTNREWLESLTDEELAKVIDVGCKHCLYATPKVYYCTASEPSCDSGVLDWLRAEHKE